MKPQRRNVLFISADQWRGECLSALGHPVVRTPRLDAFAREATLFTRHYAQAAPCGPARASMLTGLYAMNHRAILNGTPLDARHSNIALQARQAGLDPVLFGYTDTSEDPRGRHPADPALRDYGGMLPGFREGMRYDHEVCLPWLAELRRKGYPLPDDGLKVYQPAADHPALAAGSGHSRANPVYSAEDSDTAYTADRVISYLEGQGTRPWFVHAVFFRPHPPLYAPPPYDTLIDPASVAPPQRAESLATERTQHPFLDDWLERIAKPGAYMGHPVNVRDLPEHEWRQMRASYYGLIAEVDHHVGRLLDYLKRSGQYEHTLIIFTCDHGEQLGDHWLWGKGGYFDASYHIPLIIRQPDAPAGHGKRISQFTEAVDIMPTVLEWLEVPVPPNCDGQALQPLLQLQQPADWRSFVHWEYDFRDPLEHSTERALGLPSDACSLNVIRDDRYKYVHFCALPPLLFDLQRDPHETRNLANDPAYQPIQLHYAGMLLSHRMRHAERSLTGMLLTDQGLHIAPR